jgi:hypothetical protein
VILKKGRTSVATFRRDIELPRREPTTGDGRRGADAIAAAPRIDTRRLATLTADQESVVRGFLEQVALHGAVPHMRRTPPSRPSRNAGSRTRRCRPTALEIAALRAGSRCPSRRQGDVYQLSVPETITGSGLRVTLEKSRRVQTWRGYLCGDALTSVAVNVTLLAVRSLADSVRTRSALFRETVSSR